jgi:site-specific DNA-methyltransferase (adenine-specific)
MEADSIDAIVTDTPYGLSTLLDPWNLDRESLWQKLTAGQAELPIKRLMRSWLDTGENPVMKGRGFMGKEWDALVPPPNTWLEAFRVLKPGAALLAFAGTRTHDLIAMSIRFAGFEVDDEIACWLYGQGMPKRVRLDLKIDQHFGKDKDRPNVGRSTRTEKRQDFDNGGMFVTGPATSEAARFVGYDRALRPGFEPIIVARKPCRGTIAATALAYGTGGFNVDACRIPRGERGEAPMVSWATQGYGEFGTVQRPLFDSRGGYPANVVIDERVAEVSAMVCNVESRVYGSRLGAGALPAITGSEGGASRFFYTAKASTSERDKGLEGLPALTPGEKTGREDDTQGISPYAGARGDGGRNPGPCVKPLSLMRWLVRLAAPPGAHDPDISKRPVIVDMFAGSGSTLVAGLVEGVRVIGCEMDPQMADVSRRRCQHAYALPREEAGIEEAAEDDAPRGQASLF